MCRESISQCWLLGDKRWTTANYNTILKNNDNDIKCTSAEHTAAHWRVWVSCECAKEQKQLVSVLSHHFLRLLLSPSLLMACFLSDFLTRAPTTSCLKHTHTQTSQRKGRWLLQTHIIFDDAQKNYQLPFNNWAAAKQRTHSGLSS